MYSTNLMLTRFKHCHRDESAVNRGRKLRTSNQHNGFKPNQSIFMRFLQVEVESFAFTNWNDGSERKRLHQPNEKLTITLEMKLV